jgi:hypothetical protein
MLNILPSQPIVCEHIKSCKIGLASYDACFIVMEREYVYGRIGEVPNTREVGEIVGKQVCPHGLETPCITMRVSIITDNSGKNGIEWVPL